MRDHVPILLLVVVVGALAVGGFDLLTPNLRRWLSLVAAVGLITWWLGGSELGGAIRRHPMLAVSLGLGAFLLTAVSLSWLSGQ